VTGFLFVVGVGLAFLVAALAEDSDVSRPPATAIEVAEGVWIIPSLCPQGPPELAGELVEERDTIAAAPSPPAGETRRRIDGGESYDPPLIIDGELIILDERTAWYRDFRDKHLFDLVVDDEQLDAGDIAAIVATARLEKASRDKDIDELLEQTSCGFCDYSPRRADTGAEGYTPRVCPKCRRNPVISAMRAMRARKDQYREFTKELVSQYRRKPRR
jgi:hypothetical protein